MPFIHINGEFQERRNVMRLSQGNKSRTFPSRFTLTSNHKLRNPRKGTRAKHASTFVSPLSFDRTRDIARLWQGNVSVYNSAFRLTAFAFFVDSVTCSYFCKRGSMSIGRRGKFGYRRRSLMLKAFDNWGNVTFAEGFHDWRIGGGCGPFAIF